MLELITEGNAVLLRVKVVPGASRTRLLGEHDGRMRMSVAAPPEKGRANKALIAFVAKLFAVRKADVRVASGHTSALKTIRINRVDIAAVRAMFAPDQSRD